MYWQLALGLLVVINTVSVVLTKVITDKLPKKAIGIFYQYLFCVSLSILFFLFSEKGNINSVIILIGAVGFINTFGNYCQWRAFDISLSKTVLFFPLMEVTAIGLAMIFLGEINLWNIQLILGAALCFSAIWLFRSSTGNDGKIKEIFNKKWFLFTLAMILIFGVAGFLMKLFSFTVSQGTFLMGWYGGAFLGALPILRLEKQNPLQASRKTILLVFPLSLAILGSLFALYWTFQLGGPVSMVLPLRGLFITIIPVLLGWSIFKERKGLSRKEWFGFTIGIIGTILVLLR
ncbi:hypothetical protein KAS79_01755 [Candidatus Parcubacteria bacterium]|nr:hypothetical protein [Candidatus Parcubacteria bacterium]